MRKNNKLLSIFLVICMLFVDFIGPLGLNVVHAEDNNEPTYYCNHEEHTHTDECYTTYDVETSDGIKQYRFLTCDKAEHTHSEACMKADYVEPIVEEPTVIEDASTICGKQAHQHSLKCIQRVNDALLCELAEGELDADGNEHHHTDDCYAFHYEFNCGYDEEHVHDESCLPEEDEPIDPSKLSIGIDYAVTDDPDKQLDAMSVSDEFDSEELQVKSLVETFGLTENLAKDVTLRLNTEANAQNDNAKNSSLPLTVDNTTLELFTLKWITPDSTDNGNASLLYRVPAELEEQELVMQLNYALSGEHDYEVGDLQFTVPATIFKSRDGQPYGKLLIPYPEAPATKNDFNWKLIGDKYIITNTKRITSSTTGYMQFMVYDLDPTQVIDMAISDEFAVDFALMTNEGNMLVYQSEKLRAQINTEAHVENASISVTSTSPRRVNANTIPEAQRVDGETSYIIVDYIIRANVVANTLYDLTLESAAIDQYHGFVVNYQNSDDASITRFIESNVKHTGEDYNRTTRQYSVRVAYPASQFDPDVTYTFKNQLTATVEEIDPAVGNDEKLKTTVTANKVVNFIWHAPTFVPTQGHFNVSKTGTRYNRALNVLRDGDDYAITYRLSSTAYLFPFTYERNEADGDKSVRIIGNYGKHDITVETEDIGLRINGYGTMNVGTDYEYLSLALGEKPILYTVTAININDEGEFEDLTAGDGKIVYTKNNDYSTFPDYVVQLKLNDEWVDWVKVSWSTGTAVITPMDARATLDGTTVSVPAETQTFRTVVTSNVPGFVISVSPTFKLINTEKLHELVEKQFSIYNIPSILVYNDAKLHSSYAEDGREIGTIYTGSNTLNYCTLLGYTTNTKVDISKTVKQSAVKDVDYLNRWIVLHYTVKLTEQSFIEDLTIYNEAIANGDIQQTKAGIVYDLLPIGMHYVEGSLKARTGDLVKNVHVIANYADTGRDLLVADIEFKPVTSKYRSNGAYYYQDEITITYDATYDFESRKDYGDTYHNVVAFEAKNRSSFGSVEGYAGELADLSTSNHVKTETAFADEAERNAMTNLSDSTAPTFVYTGVTSTINIVSAARTSLFKDVMVNNDGVWGDGLYYGDETNALNVYTGGRYTYRLRMMNDNQTKSKHVVFYDVLENFYANEHNDPIDVDAPRWNGSLASIDTYQLEHIGIKPVIYYSTVDNLQLADADKNAIAANLDLTNTSIWIKADDYDGDLVDVKAIAVDASHMTDGSEFVLNADESLVVLVNMSAPTGDESLQLIEANAHAYNETYLMSSTSNIEIESWTNDELINKQYTKVGLVEKRIDVIKNWNDDNNRDGIRPESVTVHLYRNNADTGETVILSEDNNWSDSFRSLPYCDENGVVYVYSLVEDAIEGYTMSMDSVGDTTTITNTHEPERINLAGTKTWVNESDTEETNRPTKITVNLYANDVKVSSKVVYASSADAEGRWTYEFTNLYKYENQEEIVYRVEEIINDARYIVEVDGVNLTNFFNPFGDLLIKKNVRNATDISIQQSFEFTLTLLQNNEPVLEKFDYEIHDENDNVIQTGKIGDGDTFSLKNNEYIYISDVYSTIHYKVEEKEQPGFTAKQRVQSGNILSNEYVLVQFENTYKATGMYTPMVYKYLENQKLRRGLFRFNLDRQFYDEEYDKMYWETIAVATNNQFENVELREDGTVAYSSAPAYFGNIYFTEADAGKTYSYKVYEEYGNMSYYEYDGYSTYYLDLTIVDNGDGTLSVEPHFYDEDHNELTQEDIVFRNKYHAQGSIILRAWKTLQDGNVPLDGDEFEFELLDESGNVLQTVSNGPNGTIVFEPIQYDETAIGRTDHYAIREKVGTDDTVNYDENVYGYSITVYDNGDGTLSFSQVSATPVVEGNYPAENDVELTEGYGMGFPMKIEDDDKIVFDTSAPAFNSGLSRIVLRLLEIGDVTTTSVEYEGKTYSIPKSVIFEGKDQEIADIFDANGNSFPEDENARVYVEFDWLYDSLEGSYLMGWITGEEEIVGWNTEDAPLPIFKNGLKDGQLQISKWVNGSNYDPDTEFRFRIKLTGPGIGDEISWEFTNPAYPSIDKNIFLRSSNPSQSSNETSREDKTVNTTRRIDETPTTTTDSDNESVSSKSNTVPIPKTGSNGPYEVGEVIASGYLDGTTSSTNPGTNSWCMSWTIYSSYDLPSESDFGTYTGGYVLVLRGDDDDMPLTKATMLATDWPWHNYRSQIEAVVFVQDDPAEPGNLGTMKSMAYMFYGFSNMTYFDISDWSFEGVWYPTTNLTSTAHMFDGCSKLKSLDIWFDLGESLTKTSYMFYKCSSLETLNFGAGLGEYGYDPRQDPYPSYFNTSKVTSMSYMFNGCSSLKSLDISLLNTKKATTMQGMFYNCPALEEIRLGEDFSFYGNGINAGSSARPTLPGEYWKRVSTGETFTSDDLRNNYDGATMADTYRNASLFALLYSDGTMVFQRGTEADPSRELVQSWYVGKTTSAYRSQTDVPWFNYLSDVKHVSVKEESTPIAPKNTAYWFYGMTNLEDVDLQHLSSANLVDAGNMFNGCTSLTTVDLSSWTDLSKLVNCTSMFTNCTSLTDINLNNWNTPRLQFTDSMFKGCSALASVDLSGWSWNPSSGTYSRRMFQDCTNLVSLDISGLNTTAGVYLNDMFTNCNKLQTITFGPNWSFKGRATSSSSWVILPTPPTEFPNTGKWIRSDVAFGPYTPTELQRNYVSTMAGTWVWQNLGPSFIVNFKPGEAYGVMPSATLSAIETSTLPAQGFFGPGLRFNHWVDAEGREWADGATIPANTYEVGEEVVLTAMWDHVDSSATVNEGVFEITLRANEAALFTLPANTTYQVWEETENGWVLVYSYDTNGIIEPNETSNAVFYNEYIPTQAIVQLNGIKYLDGVNASENMFTFELYENDELLQTVSTTRGGFITFDPITYGPADVGTHTYTIKEVEPQQTSWDGEFIYSHDTHEETVVVTVVDNDGVIEATTTYDDDGIVFNNYTNPGHLEIYKEGQNRTVANSDDLFTFKITLTNRYGYPVDNDHVYWHVYNDSAPVTDDVSQWRYSTNNGGGGPIKLLSDSKISRSNDWYVIQLDLNGGIGNVNTYNEMYQGANDYTLPVESEENGVYRPGYTLVGWECVASGISSGGGEISREKIKAVVPQSLNVSQAIGFFEPGTTFTFNDLASYGYTNYKFTAIWEDSSKIYYVVNHHIKPYGSDEYQLYASERLSVDNVGEVVMPSAYESLQKAFQLETAIQPVEITGNHTVEINYYYHQKTYTVMLDGNGGTRNGNVSDEDYNDFITWTMPVTEGFMPTSGLDYGVPSVDYLFEKDHAIEFGWNTQPDGTGIAFTNWSIINKDLSQTDGDVVTIYAQWKDYDDPIYEVSNGVIYVQCRAGEVINLDLPAGTTYTIEEVDIPTGWTWQDTYGDDAGTIEAAAWTDVTFVNRYAAIGSTTMTAYKQLIGAELQPNQFRFQLNIDLDKSNIPSPANFSKMMLATNGSIDTNEFIMVDGVKQPNPYYGMAPIDFELKFNAPGTYVYRLTEYDDGSAGVTYDDKVVYVTFEVTDLGSGNLNVETSYSDGSDAPIFTNKKIASLLFGKQLVGKYTLQDIENIQFKFVVNLYDENDQPLTGTYHVYPADMTGELTGNYITDTEPFMDITLGQEFSIDGSQIIDYMEDMIERINQMLAGQPGMEPFTIEKLIEENMSGIALVIADVPSDAYYVVEEVDGGEWTMVGSQNSEGTFGQSPMGFASFALLQNALVGDGTAELQLTGTKNLIGKELTDGMFNFVVKDETGKIVSRGTNDANGNIIFDSIVYTMADAGKTFNYTVEEETDASNRMMEYDRSDKHVSVTVTDLGQQLLRLNVESDDLTWTNRAVSTIIIDKTVRGTAGNKDEAFEFVLRLTGDNVDTDTITYRLNNGDPVVVEFDENHEFVFELKHGDTMQFDGITAGATYVIVERDETYKTSIDNGTETIESKTTTGIADGMVQISYTNSKGMVIPTGLNTYNLTLLCIMCICFSLVIVMIARKRRKTNSRTI